MHVRAYDRELAEGDNAIIPESDTRRLKLLRLERLAPAVLLALFEGVPQIVHIEEPRRGIQFGIRLDSRPGSTLFAPWIPPRDTQDPQKVINDKVQVPCRPGSPGVLDLKHLNKALVARVDTHMNGGRRLRRVRARGDPLPVPAGVRRHAEPGRRSCSTSSGRPCS